MPRTKVQCWNIFLSQISIQKIFSLLRTRLNKWCQSLGIFKNDIWKKINRSASNAGKLASEKFFFAKTHRKGFFHSYSAKILIKGLEELKYHTRKQVNVHRAMSNNRNSKKSRSFRNSVRKRWFYFSGFNWTSDAHKFKPQLKTSQLSIHYRKKFLNRLCVGKENDFASSNSTFDVKSRKPILKRI